MQHIYAWCKREVRPPDGIDDHVISHSICPKCRQKVFDEEIKTLGSNPKNKLPKVNH